MRLFRQDCDRPIEAMLYGHQEVTDTTQQHTHFAKAFDSMICTTTSTNDDYARALAPCGSCCKEFGLAGKVGLHCVSGVGGDMDFSILDFSLESMKCRGCRCVLYLHGSS